MTIAKKRRKRRKGWIHVMRIPLDALEDGSDTDELVSLEGFALSDEKTAKFFQRIENGEIAGGTVNLFTGGQRLGSLVFSLTPLFPCRWLPVTPK